MAGRADSVLVRNFEKSFKTSDDGKLIIYTMGGNCCGLEVCGWGSQKASRDSLALTNHRSPYVLQSKGDMFASNPLIDQACFDIAQSSELVLTMP